MTGTKHRSFFDCINFLSGKIITKKNHIVQNLKQFDEREVLQLGFATQKMKLFR